MTSCKQILLKYILAIQAMISNYFINANEFVNQRTSEENQGFTGNY